MNGENFPTCSLSWRYLGIYVDCLEGSGEGGEGSFDERRELHSGDEEEEEACGRKLLWAAYHDPRHRGVSNPIEEYSFFDIQKDEWNDSACKASGNRHRCARLNCHEPGTHMKLVGVFKETEGMYDWTEQLFKHEGVCIWNDEDRYDEMETWMESWPQGCAQLSYPGRSEIAIALSRIAWNSLALGGPSADYDGNALYLAIQPLPQGNMTLGIYSDKSCTILSRQMTLTKYIVRLYQNSNYYSSEKGYEVASMYEQAIQNWNDSMEFFKVCQPCKAYNLNGGDDESASSHGSNDHRGRKLRFLGEDNDGDGEEQERFNCFDEAGYTNVNQCYKFETKTAMERADMKDLEVASDTILRLKVNGKTFGKGGYSSPMPKIKIVLGFLTFAIAVFLVVLVRLVQRLIRKHSKRRIPLRRGRIRKSFDDEVGYLNGGARRSLCKQGYLSEAETEQSLESEVEGGVDTTADYIPPTALDCFDGVPVESKITESFSAGQDASNEQGHPLH